MSDERDDLAKELMALYRSSRGWDAIADYILRDRQRVIDMLMVMEAHAREAAEQARRDDVQDILDSMRGCRENCSCPDKAMKRINAKLKGGPP